MPITQEGIDKGHRYVMGRINAYCPQCGTDEYLATGKVVTFLDCRYDDGDDTEYCVTDIGMNAECGDEAIGYRDGFPVCQVHADRFDALSRMAQDAED